MKRSPLLAIFLIVLVDVMGLTIVIPLLPLYAESMGASPFVAGLLVSVYGACQFVAGPILGQISDRVGRRPVLIISQIGTLIGFIILAQSTQLWHVFLSRIIDGLTAGNISVAQAHISDVTEERHRARGFGVIGVAFSIGFVIGPAISGFLAKFGYKPPILAAVALSALSIVVTSLLLPKKAASLATEKPRGTPRMPVRALIDYLGDGTVGPLLWQFFAFTFAFSVFISGFPLFAVRKYTVGGAPFDVHHIAYVYALIGLIGAVIQGGMIGRLVDRFGEKALVTFGFLSIAGGVGMLAGPATILVLVAGVSGLAVGSAVLRPSLSSTITRSVPATEQGLVIGMSQAVMSVSQITAPMAGGAVIDRGWLGLWAAAAGAIAAAGGALALRRKRG